MQQINLKEYEDSCQIPLSVQKRDLLREVLPSVSIEPIRHTSDEYRLKPSSKVGALEIGDMSVLIEPKIGIPKLLSLVCYTMGVYKPQEQELFDFQKAQTLPDLLALALIASTRRAVGRGLLRRYIAEEDALHTVRGRIRFDEQIRRRYGIPFPVDLRFDEFTEDILANRLVKAAAARLGRMTLHTGKARQGLGWIAATLENVSLLEFRRKRVPRVRFDRLNEHYRLVVGLARLILIHSEFESCRGDVRASGILIDMNKLFQEFFMLALRETLGVSSRSLRSEYTVHFDKKERVELRPDLTWWDDGDTCTFVGDAKYKTSTMAECATTTYTSCLPMPQHLTFQEGCSSMPRAGQRQGIIKSDTQKSDWRSPRSICLVLSRKYSRTSEELRTVSGIFAKKHMLQTQLKV